MAKNNGVVKATTYCMGHIKSNFRNSLEISETTKLLEEIMLVLNSSMEMMVMTYSTVDTKEQPD